MFHLYLDIYPQKMYASNKNFAQHENMSMKHSNKMVLIIGLVNRSKLWLGISMSQLFTTITAVMGFKFSNPF